MSPVRSEPDMHTSVGSAMMEELPAVESFPFNLWESASRASGSIGQFVSGVNLTTIGLILDIHYGIEQVSSSAIKFALKESTSSFLKGQKRDVYCTSYSLDSDKPKQI